MDTIVVYFVILVYMLEHLQEDPKIVCIHMPSAGIRAERGHGPSKIKYACCVNCYDTPTTITTPQNKVLIFCRRSHLSVVIDV